MTHPVKQPAGVEVPKYHTSEYAGRTHCSFFVEGKPVPKGRPRFNTRTGRAYTPASTVEWETTVAWHARIAMGSKGRLIGAVTVSLNFYGANPLADVDNLAKACLDAMNEIVYADDRQVKYTTIERTTDDPRLGVDITVKEL